MSGNGEYLALVSYQCGKVLALRTTQTHLFEGLAVHRLPDSAIQVLQPDVAVSVFRNLDDLLGVTHHFATAFGVIEVHVVVLTAKESVLNRIYGIGRFRCQLPDVVKSFDAEDTVGRSCQECAVSFGELPTGMR